MVWWCIGNTVELSFLLLPFNPRKVLWSTLYANTPGISIFEELSRLRKPPLIEDSDSEKKRDPSPELNPMIVVTVILSVHCMSSYRNIAYD